VPNVFFNQAVGTSSDIKAIERFESFLDDNHAVIAQNLHEQLLEFHSDIDREVEEKISELQERIEELEERVKELEDEE